MKLTFFHTDEIEKLTFLTVAEEAKSRGFDVEFDADFSKQTDVGITASSGVQIPGARLKVVSLHGLDQGRWSRPNFWADEDWSHFDIGLLPGKKWLRDWEEAGRNPRAHPKLGVFVNGWPKSDNYVRLSEGLSARRRQLLHELNLPFGKKVLYAPGFETDSKQLDVMEATSGLDCQLLIKHWEVHAPYSDDLVQNIRKMADLARLSFPNTIILDPAMSIFDALAVADLVVTDESTVSLEASIVGKPVIAVSDWPMRVSNDSPPRRALISQDIGLVATRATLRNSIVEALRNPKKYVYDPSGDVSYIGCAATRTIDIIQRAVTKSAYPLVEPALPRYSANPLSYAIFDNLPSRLERIAKRLWPPKRLQLSRDRQLFRKRLVRE